MAIPDKIRIAYAISTGEAVTAVEQALLEEAERAWTAAEEAFEESGGDPDYDEYPTEVDYDAHLGAAARATLDAAALKGLNDLLVCFDWYRAVMRRSWWIAHAVCNSPIPRNVDVSDVVMAAAADRIFGDLGRRHIVADVVDSRSTSEFTTAHSIAEVAHAVALHLRRVNVIDIERVGTGDSLAPIAAQLAEVAAAFAVDLSASA
jgi:hypothetical protein